VLDKDARVHDTKRTTYSAGSPLLSGTSPAPPVAKKPEAMSLAAFIGGRATGPILRKHAPQQDAHDPTQFEQHTSFTAPHPVFGKGGIAMPGMTSIGRSAPKSSPVGLPHNNMEGSPSLIDTSAKRERTLSNPPGTKRHVARAQIYTLSPQPENGLGSRERAVSTPSSASPVRQCDLYYCLNLTICSSGALVSHHHGPPSIVNHHLQTCNQKAHVESAIISQAEPAGPLLQRTRYPHH
jgi:hypothetical protein